MTGTLILLGVLVLAVASVGYEMWARTEKRRPASEVLHRSGRHEQPPRNVPEPPPDVVAALRRVEASAYAQGIKNFIAPLRGKVVRSSRAGRGGFVLFFDDGTWAAAILRSTRLDGESGDYDVPAALLQAIEGRAVGDPSTPIGPSVPYGTERCDPAREILNCHGKVVTGVAVGEDSFNFCFPEGMELDASISLDPAGRPVLRIFWEQW